VTHVAWRGLHPTKVTTSGAILCILVGSRCAAAGPAARAGLASTHPLPRPDAKKPAFPKCLSSRTRAIARARRGLPHAGRALGRAGQPDARKMQSAPSRSWPRASPQTFFPWCRHFMMRPQLSARRTSCSRRRIRSSSRFSRCRRLARRAAGARVDAARPDGLRNEGEGGGESEPARSRHGRHRERR
jgi:hypothetical protein